VDARDLRQPDLYINRELSLLAFNERVLAQALEPAFPLLERLRFLCIATTNLDEFFEIRVAGLKQQVALGAIHAGPDNMGPVEVLSAIRARAIGLVAEQYRVLNEVLIPQLEAEQIRFIKRADWTATQDAWLRDYFQEELLPVLSPLGLDPAHPFPRVLNKSLNFIVALKGKDAFGRSSRAAIVQAPRSLPRLIRLPAEATGSGPYDFVFLSSVIHAYLDDLFPGMRATGAWQFRVTRNSELFVQEEEIDDLLRAVEGELASRHYGNAVRLEVAVDTPEEMVAYLLSQFQLGRDDLYQVNGPVNLNRLQAIFDLVERPDLKFPGFVPGLPAELARSSDLFETLRRQDVLLHHPYQSFAPVIEFVRQAAADPKVLAIKQTLYRTGPESAIVDALIQAARLGKEVTVVIELRARFDEAANVGLATRLQEAGVHVVYGVVGYKTHAKMILVVRREGRGLRHYVHLGTGNYHPRTARLYTDYGLFTSDRAIGKDVHRVFLQLTSLGRGSRLARLLQSPFTLHDAILEKIQREKRNAEAGRPARIIAKTNSLIEAQTIHALYEASTAGVSIDLIVRGVCSLRPGVAGVSDNIRVRSIIGRFLEHTRVYYFENDGDPEVFCASADWMERNFFRRVEVAFPILDAALKTRLIEDLGTCLKDDAGSWELRQDGSYERIRHRKRKPFSAQQALLAQLCETS